MPSFLNDTSIELTDSLVNSSGIDEVGDNDPNAFDIFIVIIRVIITLFGLPANALVVYVVYKFDNMKTYSNIFCASLAITENLVLVHDLTVTIPSILRNTSYTTSMVSCVGYNFGNVLTVGIGFHLLIIAFDRFLHINFPFKYTNFLHWAKTPLLLCCWIPGNLIGLAIDVRACHQKAFVDDSFNVIIRCVVYGVLTIVVSLLYTSILKTALHQRKLIRRSMPTFLNAQGERTTAGSELDSIGQQIKALFGYILIGISTFISWIVPIAWLQLVHYVYKKYDNPPKDLYEVLYIMHKLVGVLMSLNSAMDPIVYSFTQRAFKDSFSKIMYRITQSCSDSMVPIGARKNTGASNTQVATVEEQNEKSKGNHLMVKNTAVQDTTCV